MIRNILNYKSPTINLITVENITSIRMKAPSLVTIPSLVIIAEVGD